jgi:hypothetical protein
MTPQERELISTFLEQLKQTQAGQKDAEADALISAAVAAKPDAAYLLVQRAVGLDYALQAAKTDLSALQAELAQLRSGKGASSSFIDTGESWGRSGKGMGQPAGAGAAPSPTSAAFTPAFSATNLARPAAVVAPAAPAPTGAWGSGMLGTVATTAAGVVAGSFLFQGIQGLMGHHGNDAQKALDPALSSVPPPALPPAQLAAADSNFGLPPDQADAAALDDAYGDYVDSGDGGDA